MEHWKPDFAEGRTEDALASLAEFSSDMMARISADGYYLYVSPSTARIFGRPIEAVVGAHIFDFVCESDKPDFAAAISKFLQSGADDFCHTARVFHADGSIRWVEVSTRLIGDATVSARRDGATTVRDVTERKILEDQLRELATTDGLTGLKNRRAFDEYIVEAWCDTARNQAELSLLLIDVDHFKQFNDSFGHQTGDDCLRAVAQAISSLPYAAAAMVARYGGEEMAVILPDTDAACALDIAEKVRLAVCALALPQSNPAIKGHSITVSIGCATAIVRPGGSHEMPNTLIASADRSLYLAKEKGRNRVEATIVLGAPRD